MISTEEKIEVLGSLGDLLNQHLENEEILLISQKAKSLNPWFTLDNCKQALKAIATQYLDRNKLIDFTEKYQLSISPNSKNVGIVMAGNIPGVGFHDMLSTFICNHRSLIKLSSKDEVIIKYIIEKLIDIDSRVGEYFSIVEKLSDYDAVIATGGNNTSRYFEYYFKHVPHIIRKNRNGVALFFGDEGIDDIRALGRDIFSYFGLGCRNVSKIFIPQNFEIEKILEVLDEEKEIIHHNKYKNNFDYNMALFLLNKEKFLHNGNVLMKEDDQIASRIACLHYSRYTDDSELLDTLAAKRDEIQCIISQRPVAEFEVFPFGQAQSPGLTSFADGVDTVQFLLGL